MTYERDERRGKQHEAAISKTGTAGQQLLPGRRTLSEGLDPGSTSRAVGVSEPGRPRSVLDEHGLGGLGTTNAGGSSTLSVAETEAYAARGVPAVLHSSGDGPKEVTPAAAVATYLKANSRQIWRAVGNHLLAVAWPERHPRLSIHDRAFTVAVLENLEVRLRDFDPFSHVAEVLYPEKLVAAIEPFLPAGSRWVPTIGLTIAQLFHGAIAASLQRLAPRFVEAADARGDGLAAYAELIASHPMDRSVGRALTSRGAAEAMASADKRPPTRRTTLRTVTIEWEGRRDPRLWNWVRATKPADATVEEVAAALFQRARGKLDGDEPSSFAYALATAAPLFGLPRSWAIAFPEAKAAAPKQALEGKSSDDTAEARLAAASDTVAADDIAVAQAASLPAAPGAATAAHVVDELRDARTQLGYLANALAPWGLGDRIEIAQRAVNRKIVDLATADTKTAARWASIAADQKRHLFQITGGVAKLVESASSVGATDPRASAAQPIREILGIYAAAASASQLSATCEALIATANAKVAGLAVTAVQNTSRELQLSIDQTREAIGTDYAMRDIGRQQSVAEGELRHLHAQMLSGVAVKADEMDRITLEAEELSLRTRLHGTIVQVGNLQSAAINATDGIAAHVAVSVEWIKADIQGVSSKILGEVGRVNVEWIVENQRQDAALEKQIANPALRQIKSREGRRARLGRARERFARISADRDIVNFLNKGKDLVEDQQFATACVRVAAMVGVSLIGNVAGGLVSRGLGRWMMARSGVQAIVQLSTRARLAAQGAGFVSEAAVTALGQVAVNGGSLGEQFFENLLTSLGTAAILSRIGGNLSAAKSLELKSSGFWAKAGRGAGFVLKETAVISSQMIMGAAIGYVAHMVVTGKSQPPPTKAKAKEWLLQGASMAAGRYMHKALGDRMPGLHQLAKHKDFEPGRRLLAQAEELRQIAGAVTRSGDADMALDLLARRTRLLEAELAALDQYALKLGKPGDEPIFKELATERANLETQLGEIRSQEMVDARMHLAGLEELVPGRVWKGTDKQIAHAVDAVGGAGKKVTETHDPATGVRRLEVDGRKLELHGETGTRTPTSRELMDGMTTAKPAKAAISPDQHSRGRNKTGEPKHVGPGTQAKPASGRVAEPVPGLYDSVDPNYQPAGWQILDRGPPQPHPDHPELIQITTDVIAPNGTTGWIERSYDPKKKMVVMENAFLQNLPSWIDAGKAMVPNKGTPTVTYLTLRQMKLLGANFGEVKTIKMSTIQNIEAVMQLEQMKRAGEPIEQAVPKTHSVQYATTSIEQSGHTITSVRIEASNAWQWDLQGMMDHFRMDPAQRQKLFAKYGLGPTDTVLVNYDVYIDVASHPKNP